MLSTSGRVAFRPTNQALALPSAPPLAGQPTSPCRTSPGSRSVAHIPIQDPKVDAGLDRRVGAEDKTLDVRWALCGGGGGHGVSPLQHPDDAPTPTGEWHSEESHCPNDTKLAAVPGCPKPAPGASREAPVTSCGQRAYPQGQATRRPERHPGCVQ